jgi:hypothetical protein
MIWENRKGHKGQEIDMAPAEAIEKNLVRVTNLAHQVRRKP